MGWIARHWRWMLFSIVTAVVVAIFAPIDYHDRDFATYWVGSRLLLQHADPYDAATWIPALREVAPLLTRVTPPGAGYSYPLWTAVLTLPYAVLPFDIASRAWLGSQAFAGLLGMGALLSVVGVMRRSAETVLLMTLLLTAQSSQMLMEVANMQGFLLAIISGSLALLLSGHALGAGLLLALVAAKPHLVLFFIPFLLIVDRDRVRLAMGMAITGAIFVLASFAVRPTWVGDWLATLGHFGAGLGARATAWGLGPMIGVPGAVPVVLAVAVFAAWWRTRPPRPLLYGGALSISLFIAPYAGRYDALVLFAALVIAVASLHAAAPSARALALLLIVIVASPLPWFLHLLVLVDVKEAVGSLVPLATFATIVLCDRYARAGTRAAAPA